MDILSLPPIALVSLAVALAAGLVAGVFLAFSDFLMRALAAAPPAAGAEAMQIINRAVFRTVFMVLLIGLVPVAGAVAAHGWFGPGGAAGALQVAGAAVYGAGVMGVTILGNVPRNERLAAFPDGSAAAAEYWPSYVPGWTRWNHVRWVSAAVASACFMLAALHLAA